MILEVVTQDTPLVAHTLFEMEIILNWRLTSAPQQTLYMILCVTLHTCAKVRIRSLEYATL